MLRFVPTLGLVLASGCYASYFDPEDGVVSDVVADGPVRADEVAAADASRDDPGSPDRGWGDCRPALEVTLVPGGDCLDVEIPADAARTAIPCVGETGYLVLVHRPEGVECCILVTADADRICAESYESRDWPCSCVGTRGGVCATTGGTRSSVSFRPWGAPNATFLLWLEGWDGTAIQLRICPYRAAWC